MVYSFGYVGVAALIALQNLFPPIPSALILSLAGFLIGQGYFLFFPALLAATTGSVSSALVFYTLGRRVGEERLRKLVERFGRFALVTESDLEKALGWFGRYGGKAVLFGHLVPGVGTFVSVPAGLARMPVLRFVAYTAMGTTLWNGAFIGLGGALGARWQLAQRYLHTFVRAAGRRAGRRPLVPGAPVADALIAHAQPAAFAGLSLGPQRAEGR